MNKGKNKYFVPLFSLTNTFEALTHRSVKNGAKCHGPIFSPVQEVPDTKEQCDAVLSAILI